MRVHRILIMMLLAASIASAQSYQIDWYVIASGGGQAESDNYQIDGTLGQAIVGQSSSDNYIVEAGFWFNGAPPGGDCVYIPGDCNHNGNELELGDVIAMIGMYVGLFPPSYICDCGVDPPGSEFAATADPNGNCVALQLGDVITEIFAYRGWVTASGCEDCPGSGRLLPGGDNRPLVMPRLKTRAVRKASASQ